MKLALEPAVFDDNGNLKLMPDERLLAKKKLSCWVYRKGPLLKKGSAQVTVFYTGRGVVYRTNQRIISTKTLGEGVVGDDTCIEAPINEVIRCKRGMIGVTLVCKELEDDRYYIDLMPRKSAKKFLGEVLYYKSIRRIK